MRRVHAVLIASLVGCGGDDGGVGDTDGEATGSATMSTSGPTSASTSGSESGPDVTSDDASSGGPGGSTVSEGSESGPGSSTTGPEGTDGCGLATTDPTMQWTEHTIDVGGVSRQYYVWLPEPYDAERPYPIVYQFHGCSGSEDRQNNNPPVQDESGADAIHIRGKAVDDCWDLTPGGPDVLFFDALVAEAEATWCANPERRFVTGYSSGAFMTHRIACERGDVVRGVASIAGGVTGNACAGQTAALLIHDTDDQTVNISASEGARDSHLMRNGCDADAPTEPFDPSPCAAYTGCAEGFPVVWCQTSGQDHSRQDALSAPAFWGFLSGLD